MQPVAIMPQLAVRIKRRLKKKEEGRVVLSLASGADGLTLTEGPLGARRFATHRLTVAGGRTAWAFRAD